MEIKRDGYLGKLVSRKGNGLIKVVTGVRRCGKSYLLFTLFKNHLLESCVPADHIIEAQLDRRQSASLRDPDRALEFIYSRIKDDSMHYVLLDEVQLMDDFVGVLNDLIYERNIDCYVTGSNARFLARDVVTEFRGRGDQVRLHPLSFAEFMQARPDGDAYRGLADYMTYGGLPFVTTMEGEAQKRAYLKDLFAETYLIDIIERNKVAKTQELDDLIDVLASSTGSLTSVAKIRATFASKLGSGVSDSTLKSYIGYLEDAFLVNKAQRYDVKGRRYIGSPVKYYFEDTGLRNARLGFRQNEETHLMENVVYNELRARGFSVDVGIVHRRHVDEQGVKREDALEIDFIANAGSQRYYIQSAYAIPDRAKREQETASLLRVKDSFKKIVLVHDVMNAWHDNNGILYMSLFDFLLDKGSLDW